jgi:hypothetical protein
MNRLNGRLAKLERADGPLRCPDCRLPHQREFSTVDDLLDAVDVGLACVVNTTCRTCPECLAFISIMVRHRAEVERRLGAGWRDPPAAEGAA